MAAIDDIVNISITRETSGLSGVGFGTTLVLASVSAAVVTAWGPDRVRVYTSAAAMLAASEGFTINDAAYKLVAAQFSQKPKPTRVKLGQRIRSQTQTVWLTPTNLTAGYTYAGVVTGTAGAQAWSYMIPASPSPTLAIVCTGIAEAITDLASDGVAATGSSGTEVVCTSTAGLVTEFTGMANPQALLVEDKTADPGIATDAAEVTAVDPDWYGLVSDAFGKAEIEALTAWADTEGFINYHYTTADSVVATSTYASNGTDVGDYLKAHGCARATGWWSQDISCSGPAACAIAALAVKIPGSYDYVYKTLVGPAPSNQLTATQTANLSTKNVGYYQTLGSLGRTFGGKVAGGEYTDNVVFLDWWANTTQVAIVGYMVSKDKVPYTDAGIVAIGGQIDIVGAQGVANGGIAPGSFVTTLPTAASESLSNREARTVPDISVAFRLAGAIRTAAVSARVAS